MNEMDVSNMRVVDLRAALEAYGLPKSGTKKTLQDRLLQFLAQQQQQQQQPQQHQQVVYDQEEQEQQRQSALLLAAQEQQQQALELLQQQQLQQQQLQEQQRQKELMEQQRQEALEEEQRQLMEERQRQIEEQQRQQLLLEEQQQQQLLMVEQQRQRELEEERRQQELEEQQRVRQLEEQKRQRELEEQQKKKKIEEQQRRKEIEEEQRQKELEEEQKRKEIEEFQRKKEIQEEEEIQKALEEEQRKKELEEQERQREQQQNVKELEDRKCEEEDKERVLEQRKEIKERQRLEQREAEKEQSKRYLEEEKQRQRESKEKEMQKDIAVEEKMEKEDRDEDTLSTREESSAQSEEVHDQETLQILATNEILSLEENNEEFKELKKDKKSICSASKDKESISTKESDIEGSKIKSGEDEFDELDIKPPERPLTPLRQLNLKTKPAIEEDNYAKGAWNRIRSMSSNDENNVVISSENLRDLVPDPQPLFNKNGPDYANEKNPSTESRDCSTAKPSYETLTETAQVSEEKKMHKLPLIDDSATDLAAQDSTDKVATWVQIRNLMRPFTQYQLKEILNRQGTVTELWLDKIKSVCFALYSSKNKALEAVSSLNGIRWPSSNSKNIVVELSTSEEMEARKQLDKLGQNSYDGSGLKRKLTSSDGDDRTKDGLPKDEINDIKKSIKRVRREEDNGDGKSVKKSLRALTDLFNRTNVKPLIYWKPRQQLEEMKKANSATKGESGTSKMEDIKHPIDQKAIRSDIELVVMCNNSEEKMDFHARKKTGSQDQEDISPLSPLIGN